MLERLKVWARDLKRDLVALAGAARDPRTPWIARLVALAVVAYALSPIDLIPDFIPVLGHLDDLILVPLGLWLAIKLIPPEVLAEHRARAVSADNPGQNRDAAAVIIGLWVAAAIVLARWLMAP